LHQRPIRTLICVFWLDAIHQEFPDDTRLLLAVARFWQYRHGLHESDGVIVYDDRAVIPPSLRPIVLETLHSAHQGVSTMTVRARSIIFWPGMTDDINRVRTNCTQCIANAPSQASLPATPHQPHPPPHSRGCSPTSSGHHYLVIGDRLSGWCDVFRSSHGSPKQEQKA